MIRKTTAGAFLALGLFALPGAALANGDGGTGYFVAPGKSKASPAWTPEVTGRMPLAANAPTRVLPLTVAPNWRAASTRVPVGEKPAVSPGAWSFHNAGGNGNG